MLLDLDISRVCKGPRASETRPATGLRAGFISPARELRWRVAQSWAGSWHRLLASVIENSTRALALHIRELPDVSPVEYAMYIKLPKPYHNAAVWAFVTHGIVLVPVRIRVSAAP